MQNPPMAIKKTRGAVMNMLLKLKCEKCQDCLKGWIRSKARKLSDVVSSEEALLFAAWAHTSLHHKSKVEVTV